MAERFPCSYPPEDVTFLAELAEASPVGAAELRGAVGSGERAIFQMVTAEPEPDAAQLGLFRDALARNRGRLARDVRATAAALADRRPGGVALLSLVRAGVPLGILVARELRRRGVPCRHYAVSLVREVGVDWIALDRVLADHAPGEVAFLDGWTGKGATGASLSASVAEYAACRGVRLDGGLHVVQDISGTAPVAGGDEDYLVPSAMLNAAVHGLVSRTILPDPSAARTRLHACAVFAAPACGDLSDGFLRAVEAAEPAPPASRRDPAALRQASSAFMAAVAARFGVADRNRIKPGVNEATRAAVLRVPDAVLVRDAGDPEVAHILRAAAASSAPVLVDPAMPYAACVVTGPLKVGG